jgi:isoamylase
LQSAGRVLPGDPVPLGANPDGRGTHFSLFSEVATRVELCLFDQAGEGNHLGPMLSLKGIDNGAYYRTVEGDDRYYMDYTGTGNSLNMRHPHVQQLIMDSLRYWVSEMHVDGFRFDLASTLARGMFEVDRLSAFFDVIHQDPVL